MDQLKKDENQLFLKEIIKLVVVRTGLDGFAGNGLAAPSSDRIALNYFPTKLANVLSKTSKSIPVSHLKVCQNNIV